MKKISKFANVLDVFFKILFWLQIAAAIVVLIFYCLMLFIPNSFENLSHTLSVGNLELTLLPDFSPKISELNIVFGLHIAVMLVNVAVACIAIKIIRRILNPMKEERPFDSSVSRDLRKLGWLSLVLGFVVSFGKAVAEITTFAVYNVADLFTQEKISSIMLNETIDISFLVVPVVMFFMSYIFRYGEELQKQSDETL